MTVDTTARPASRRRGGRTANATLLLPAALRATIDNYASSLSMTVPQLLCHALIPQLQDLRDGKPLTNSQDAPDDAFVESNVRIPVEISDLVTLYSNKLRVSKAAIYRAALEREVSGFASDEHEQALWDRVTAGGFAD